MTGDKELTLRTFLVMIENRIIKKAQMTEPQKNIKKRLLLDISFPVISQITKIETKAKPNEII